MKLLAWLASLAAAGVPTLTHISFSDHQALAEEQSPKSASRGVTARAASTSSGLSLGRSIAV
jgi:hypothetical protein